MAQDHVSQANQEQVYLYNRPRFLYVGFQLSLLVMEVSPPAGYGFHPLLEGLAAAE